MRTLAKKLTAYQRHVRSFSKTYTGKPKNMMKAAAKAWRQKSTSAKKKKPKTGSPRKKEQKRRTKSMAKKKTKRRSGFRLPGGLGPKGIGMGILGLMVVPRFLPGQSPGATKLAAGLGLRALKVGGGGPLAAVGIMELVAEQAARLLGGGGVSFAGGNGAMRFDY